MLARHRLDLRRLFTPDALAVALLFAFALALRVYGVGGSLPYVGHPDEPKLIDSAIHIVKSGDLNPHLYIWPSLYIYIAALVVKAHLLWGVLRGYYTGPQSLPDVTHIFSLAPGVYVWARTLTAVVGAATVALLYVVGREMFNGSRRVGVVAALALAVSPLHIEYSHYALTDVPLGLMGLLVLWASYNLSRTRIGEGDGRVYDALFWRSTLCGLLVGLAAGTKYNGIYLGLVPAVALLMAFSRGMREPAESAARPAAGAKRRRSRGMSEAPERSEDDQGLPTPLAPDPRSLTPEKRLSPARRVRLAFSGMALAVVGGFLLAEPYALLDFPSFSQGFSFQVGAYLPAQDLGQVWDSVQSHVSALSVSDGYFFMPAALGALVLLFNPPVRNRAWLLILFPVFYVLAMSRFYLTYVRNLIVTLPFLAVMSGYALDLAAMQVTTMARGWVRIANRHVWGAVRWGLVGLALVYVLAEPLRVSVNYVLYMADPESRNLAWSWMQQQMRQGARFAAELHPWQVQDWPDVLAYDVENPDTLNPLTARPPDWFANHGYRYVVLNSNYKDSLRDPAMLALYRQLTLVKEFAGDKQGGKGPTISVYSTEAAGSQTADGADPGFMMKKSGARLEDFAVLAGFDLAPLTSANMLLDPPPSVPSMAKPPVAATFKPGEAAGLNLYYHALRDGKKTDPNWQVWVHLVDPASGKTVAQVDVQPLTGRLKAYPGISQQPHPVSQWHQGELLAGIYNFNLPPDLKAGTYRLDTGMWIPPNGPGAGITYNPPDANLPRDHVVLGEITVK
jgi:hypothetical protein